MPFETFKRQRAPMTLEPAITIQKRGTMSLNVPAYQGLGSPEAIELLWDREKRLMAMRKVARETPHAYLVRPLGKSESNWLISGRAFVTYYGIEADVARRYMGRMDDDMLVIDLKEPGVQVTSNRDRAKDRQGTLGVS